MRWSRRSAMAVLAALVVGISVSAQSQDEATRLGKDWPVVGGDLTNARYSPLDQINKDTVGDLGAAWKLTFDQGGASRATPVVQDGRLFIAAGADVYAVDPTNGEKIWTSRLEESEAPDTTTVWGIRDAWSMQGAFPTPQGLALGGGLVFVGLTNGSVAALRQDTGELVWAQLIGNDPKQSRGQSVSGAPTYAEGIVFAGLASGDWGVQSRVVALDAETGEELWRFNTIPGPGEPGHETWPENSHVWGLGGGGVWQVGAVDVELGLVYFGTGNAGPVHGGEIRKGDNLYTNSALALDMKTGELRWHYQIVHHDIWDWDVANALVLFDDEVGGELVRGVAVVRSDGYFFFLDRETGEPLMPTEERAVPQNAFLHTSPTQPYPLGADKLMPECETWSDEVPPPFLLDCSGFTPISLDVHNVVMPGGGVSRTTPILYSPQTGYFYALVTSSLMRPRRYSDDPWVWGRDTYPLTLPRGTDFLTAVDGGTHKLGWRKEMPLGGAGGVVRSAGGGLLTTAGGLVFRAAVDGHFEAFDAETGDRLWQFQTGRVGRGPAAAYEIDGEQYVALALGRTLLGFKLGGTLPPEPAPDVPSQAPPVRVTDEIETGTWSQSTSGNFGRRWAFDEHTFSPVRARAKVGDFVRFMNNGDVVHTVVARDGSWSTPSLRPAEKYAVTFEQEGSFLFHCQEHPWAIGELTVEP